MKNGWWKGLCSASGTVVWEARLRQSDLERDAAAWRLARHVTRSSVSMRVRRRLARLLRAVARWLSPELQPRLSPEEYSLT